jgi:hypothetical protein
MSPKGKLVFFVIAFAAFAFEAIRSKSIVAGGLAAFTVPFAYDAYDAI